MLELKQPTPTAPAGSPAPNSTAALAEQSLAPDAVSSAAEARSAIFAGVGGSMFDLVALAQLSDQAWTEGGSAAELYRTALSRRENLEAARTTRRAAAFEFLTQNPSMAAVDICRDAMAIGHLDGRCSETARQAAAVLLTLDTPEAQECLLDTVRGPSCCRQRAALGAISNSGGPQYTEVMLEMLTRGESRTAAAAGLSRLLDDAEFASAEPRSRILQNLFKTAIYSDHHDSTAAFIAKRALLTHGDSSTILSARRLLLDSGAVHDNFTALELLTGLDSGTALEDTLVRALKSSFKAPEVYVRIASLLKEGGVEQKTELQKIAGEAEGWPRSIGAVFKRLSTLLPTSSYLSGTGTWAKKQIAARSASAASCL